MLPLQGHDDTWIAHQDDFTATLDELNQIHGKGKEKEKSESANVPAFASTASSSLEASSKAAKKRVQYVIIEKNKA